MSDATERCEAAADGSLREGDLKFAGLISCQMGKIWTMSKAHPPFIQEMLPVYTLPLLEVHCDPL